ncbi:MAG: inositol monophosphatase family protein [Planctomycetales bacterium]
MEFTHDDLLESAIAAGWAAARVLDDWSRRFTVSEKSPANLVTEADFESQRAIHELLRARYPEHRFLGEEGLSDEGPAPYRWIIDPLDGTSNYVHGFPYYAVSIGVEHEGELIAGVILDPTRKELFAAARGRGATLNGEPIRPSRAERLNEALVMVSLPVAVKPGHPAVERFVRTMSAAQATQRTGSAALNLAYTACGRIDAFFSTSLRPWDMAAGALIVREAGGRVSQIGGGTFDVEAPDILATNGTALHEELRQLLR